MSDTRVCYLVLSYVVVWRSDDGDGDEIDYTLLSVHDSPPQPQEPGRVCRRALISEDVQGSCQILSAEETTAYRDVIRGAAKKKIRRGRDGGYVVEDYSQT